MSPSIITCLLVAGALQQLDAVAIGGEFFVPAVLACHELARDRDDLTGSGKDLVDQRRSDAEPGGEHLRLRDVVEILVRDLVCEHGPQMVVVRALEQPRGHEEPPRRPRSPR